MEIIIGVISFTLIVLILVLFVTGARRFLVPTGECRIEINRRHTVTAEVGRRLLEVLATSGISLPSACGGAGTCGLCKARVTGGGGEPGPQELAQLTRREASHKYRLACQVPVLSPLSVEVDDAYFGIRKWSCTVTDTHNVASLIREITLQLPAGEDVEFKPGGFVQITCPPFKARFADFKIDSEYHDIWEKLDLWRLEANSTSPVTRAYSMANHPGERGRIMLNVRIALPPPGRRGVPPGSVSSWLFSLERGATVQIEGPFGHFFVQDSDREAIFIGGGAGMAPLRAQILDLLQNQQSRRKISFWYGARSMRELFYSDQFEGLAADNANFEWHVALSEPEPEDDWQGLEGFVHKVLLDEYLASHPAPEECEYYICGPPMMVKAVLATLDNLGVEEDMIFYDDFSS